MKDGGRFNVFARVDGQGEAHLTAENPRKAGPVGR